MNNTFVEEIRKAVAEELQDKIVVVKEVEKENGVVHTGLNIRSEDCNISPNIYIIEGKSVEENVRGILKTYELYVPKKSAETSWFMDYEQVKGKLAVMLTSKPINGLAKRKAPGFDDLYMHAYVIVSDPSFGTGDMKVREEYLKGWGITNEELFEDALKSAPFVMPAEKRGMAETLGIIKSGIPVPCEVIDEDPLTIVSNKHYMLGAAAILYTKVKENTIMIPSSIHEVLLVDGNIVDSSDELNRMINEVNNSCLLPEEFLSNHAYRWNGTKWENVA